MRQRPYRDKGEISQTFNDGLLTVYAVEPNTVPDGVTLTGLMEKAKLFYAERRMGVQRYYAGIQAQIRLDRVVRCPKTSFVQPHDVVVTESGEHYTVQLIQTCPDVYPACVDISLSAIKQLYAEAVLICRSWADGGWKETGRVVRCSIQGVDTKEFYAAHAADFHPELTVVLPDYRDYQGETLVDIAGSRYRILRATRNEQQIMLLAERAPVDDAQEVDPDE